MEDVKFLKGEKIYLRPVKKQDLEGDYLCWINDTGNDEFTEHAQFPHSLDELELFAQNKWRDSSCIWLAIVEEETGRHIGNIELCNIDRVHRKAEYKIILDKACHGKGYGSEASYLFLRHAFCVLNLHRVYLGVNEDNKRAIKLYEKLGFVQEGMLREAFLRDGKRKSTLIMGLLVNEFKNKEVYD